MVAKQKSAQKCLKFKDVFSQNSLLKSNEIFVTAKMIFPEHTADILAQKQTLEQYGT